MIILNKLTDFGALSTFWTDTGFEISSSASSNRPSSIIISQFSKRFVQSNFLHSESTKQNNVFKSYTRFIQSVTLFDWGYVLIEMSEQELFQKHFPFRKKSSNVNH